MEIIAFIILILVWYYGYSLLSAIRFNTKALSDQYTELLNIVIEAGVNIRDINSHLSDIRTHTFRASVDLEHFLKEDLKSLQEKLSEISALSVSLSDINDKLGIIDNSVDAIVSHPAFSSSDDDDNKYSI